MFSEDVANWLTRHLGTVPYLVLAFALGLLVPVLLGVAFAYLFAKRRGGWAGFLLGTGVALWASLCWLSVPYCGGYPCLPGLLLTLLLFGGPADDTLAKELVVHAVNFVVWPVAGWLLFRTRARLIRTAPETPAGRPRR